MKKILIFIFILHFISNIKAQINCGTKTPVIDSLTMINPQAKLAPLNNATIKLFFHIIRKSDGNDNNSISIFDAVNAMFGLAPIYNPHNICFVLKGWGYINENDYYNDFNFSDNACNNLSNTNVNTDAIDVYIVPNSNSSIQGIAFSGIPGRSLIIQKQAMIGGKNIFAHELGHCLGLYHTFQTTSQDIPWACPENINGSNCSTCGDLVCDTPADNNGPTDGNCNYIGGGGYNPLVNNIMSYYDGCLSQLTVGQGNRMLSVIANTQGLLDRLAPNNISISQTTYPLIIGPASCNNPLPPSFCPPPIFNLLEIGKTKVSTSGNVVVNPASTVNNPFNQTTTIGFVSENEIELLPGFEVNEGAKFAAVISPACPASVNFRTNGNTGNGNPYELFSEEFNTQNNLSADMDNTSKLITKEVKSDFEIIPNPNNGYFEIIFKNSNDLPQNIVIIDAQGKEVNRINKPNEYKYTLDIKEMRSGLYIIHTLYADKTISRRFIKN